MDDVKKVQTFDGNVVLTQGTLQIRTKRLVVTQDADGFQKGVATGGANGLARFRQKREGSAEYIEGEAERIEHDAATRKPNSSAAPGSRAPVTKCAGRTFHTMR